MINELDIVALVTDLPEEELRAGDVGTVVMAYRNGAAFEVEFMTIGGRTIAVTTVEASQLRLVSPDDISQARPLATA